MIFLIIFWIQMLSNRYSLRQFWSHEFISLRKIMAFYMSSQICCLWKCFATQRTGCSGTLSLLLSSLTGPTISSISVDLLFWITWFTLKWQILFSVWFERMIQIIEQVNDFSCFKQFWQEPKPNVPSPTTIWWLRNRFYKNNRDKNGIQYYCPVNK